MADVPDGRHRPDVWTIAPFPPVRLGRTLRIGKICEGGTPALRCIEPAPDRESIHGRRYLHHRGHRDLSLDRSVRAAWTDLGRGAPREAMVRRGRGPRSRRARYGRAGALRERREAPMLLVLGRQTSANVQKAVWCHCELKL